jgi:flagellar biosynthetic protein FliQ
MAVGLLIALFQALTQIQEATLTFVPKMVVVAVVIGLSSTYIGSRFQIFTQNVYGRIETGFRK